MLLGLGAILSSLADIFLDYDATLVEINPLALTGDGKLIALDCHIEMDDDALYGTRIRPKNWLWTTDTKGVEKVRSLNARQPKLIIWIIEGLPAG